MSDLDAKVARGIALLDDRMPGWRQRIDLDLLDMSSCDFCILGQLFGDYDDGFVALGLDRGCPYGFDDEDEDYLELARTWDRALTEAEGGGS